ncbi:MAG: hypothetical protein LBH73_01665, partial [Spirochaetaceae bacterium]|nr:hypothetical protein [Spirochaetaceae bacterium]
MKKSAIVMLCILLALVVLGGQSCKKTGSSSETVISLNVATAGDTNMLEFFQNYIGPAFTGKHPGIRLNVVGTGPGDDGSRTIYTKWKAQLDAGRSDWDIDVGCVNESIMADMINDKVIEQYVPGISNAGYVNTRSSEY